MKINRLYTLSQFVDLVRSKGTNLGDQLIYSYNDFLKQEIKEEMFYNKVAKPNPDQYMYDCKTMEVQNKLHVEAQKKVVFEGFYKQWEGEGYYYDFKDGYLWKYGNAWCVGFNGDEIDVKTLEDLANATNGELTINIEV